MKNREFSFIIILLVVLLAVFGGTAKMRSATVGGDTLQDSPPTFSAAPTPTAPEQSPSPADPTDDPRPSETPTADPEYFTLNFIGDCTLASVSYYQGTASGYDTVIGDDFAYPFAKTKYLFEDDDMTFANLECALTTSTDAANKTFVFKADADFAQIMSLGSIEFVTLANNHILDYGEQGCQDTKDALDAVGVAYAGRDEYAVYETESGLRIGVYALSFGTVDQINAGIAAVKALDVDFIIAAMHWGDEGSYTVNQEQIKLAHACIDAGADFVYGSHPHTLQPYEEYNGKYIYYSMGNWTFGGNTAPRDKDTFILRLTLERAPDGTVSVIDRQHIPAACADPDSSNNYQPVLYEEGSEEYARVLSKLDGSFTGQNLSIGYQYSNNE